MRLSISQVKTGGNSKHKRRRTLLNFYNKPPITLFYLAHHGVEGQKWRIRRGPPYPLGVRRNRRANKNKKKKVARLRKNGTIIEDIPIHKSLGAKSKNYQVYDPESGRYYPFAEGTRIRNPKVFAGKGGVKKLRPEVMLGLSEQLGGKPTEWQHCKGIGTLDCDGEEYDAEVHWFQEPSVGKHRFKVKHWFDK